MIEIYTREKEKTSRLLKNMNTSSKIECFEGGIRIKIKKGNFQNVNKILISNGVNVENIYCKKNSLEDYFFNVMEGDNEYA
ncbi:hypothetical protein JTT02_08710 [Clostridium botulinum]|nr:hypothetical protein [Clostridium botulinum]MCS4461433.1 hypothetical protein [Clostridium botulinum]MCS4519118.1 hypothetical protein [Clostridium botulinum]